MDYTYNWNVNWSNESEGYDLNKEAAAIKLAAQREFIILDDVLSSEQILTIKETYPELINFLMSEEVGGNVKEKMEEYIVNCMYSKKEINLNDAIKFALSGFESGYEF